jgi:hypothetical protein
LVYLSSKDKITLCQTVYLVCPHHQFDLSPAQTNIWMMPLLFGNCADSVGEIQGLAKILEDEFPFAFAPENTPAATAITEP